MRLKLPDYSTLSENDILFIEANPQPIDKLWLLWHRKTIKEISLELGISPQAVSAQLKRLKIKRYRKECKSPISRQIRTSEQYKIWAKTIKQRDNYTYQKCNKRGNGELHAHHIKPFASYPELRFDINNGITYCKACHRKTFKRTGL